MSERLWNCGCHKWMHGTEDACDLYLPERRPARPTCPFIVSYRNALTRQLAEVHAEMASIPNGIIPVYGLREDQKIADVLGMTATGAVMAREQYLSNFYARAATGPSWWQQMLSGAAAVAMHSRKR